MDIGGVNKIKAAYPSRERAGIDRSKDPSSDRDPHGKQQREEAPIEKLSPEQEEEALRKLNLQPAFKGNGLRAELVRDDGKRPHIVVKRFDGEVVRKLPYSQIVSIYLGQSEEEPTGLLLKKSA